MRTWWKRLANSVGLVDIRNLERVQVAAQSELELGHSLALLDFDGCKSQSREFSTKVMFQPYTWHPFAGTF